MESANLRLLRASKMTVDLSTLQKGDKVKFRCGGEAVASEVECGAFFIAISFSGSNIQYIYNSSGYYWHEGGDAIFDIVEIISAAPSAQNLKKGDRVIYKSVTWGEKKATYIGDHQDMAIIYIDNGSTVWGAMQVGFEQIKFIKEKE